ncbi:integrator complex subunit 7 isoform X2 [Toxorhynchites rutilus septentrionalis]|uniref:integrator complex subunit 7 isoform X2 n=1 Tax=Toxorhynchites rutilus septentrionalis TaxID=329112 RepID=UPI00247861E5|nr:integrator complex subunit 7 isoform X2 [Toxorhynchites rutilus septentrionalis]
MMGTRANIFNESFLNETDQDANSVLIELDKGLRSAKTGEQCEAIIRFPKLFEKYPFPILINSSFLKLAEFFRIGSNLSRLWVLRVCQQSEKHLEKIVNVDEFVKRIFMVIHSNDPVARALTLRTLGAVACVIPEKQQVHHAIRNALDSHDTVEVEAAIYASVQFAAQSKTFAIGMCSKVASMIESLQTPVSMKILLIPVLRHMYHDANTAALVKTLCRNLLPKYPSEQFVIAIIQSLSHLSYVTSVDIPDQVDLLLGYLIDPRKRVQLAVLQSLNKLAERGAYLWPKWAINKLLKLTMQCSYPNIALDVMVTLTGCPTTCHTMLNEERNQLLEVCKHCLLLEQNTGGKALTILTRLVSYCRTENIPPPICFIEHLNMNLEYLIHSALHNKAPLKDFKIYLRCGIQLSKINQEFGENFAETLAELLVEDSEYSVPHLKLICEALGAICSSFSTSYQIAQNQTDEIHHPLKAILIPILTKLESYNEASTLDRNDTCVIELLVSISLQAMLGSLMNERVMQIYNNLLKFLNYWTQYRIARYGQHFLAALIYQKLCKHVSLEKLHFYLTAMFQISKAECMLNYDAEYEQLVLDFPGNLQPDNSKSSLLDRLEKAINLYCMAQSTLKATSSPQHPMNFQLEVINLRCQFLQVLHGIVVSRNTLCITPPSAISNTLAQNLRDPLQKFGHVTNQLRKNVKILKSCEEAYCKLYKSSFDADPCTLEYLNIIQHLCSIMQTSIETISFTTPTDSANHPPNCSYPETRYLLFICQTVSKQMQTFPNEISSTKSITNKHMDMLLRQIEIVIKSAHCMPRFFFQVLQNTSVKLALTPQPRIAGEPILVPPNSNLVVKVEGVIQHYGKKPSLFRSIESVQITLSTQYVTARMNDIKINTENTVLTQIVKPHRDFLSGNFLLSLNNAVQAYPGASVSSGGQWQVTLETCVIDHDGIVWTAGPKSVLHVRIPEDNHKQSMNVQSSARRF